MSLARQDYESLRGKDPELPGDGKEVLFKNNAETRAFQRGIEASQLKDDIQSLVHEWSTINLKGGTKKAFESLLKNGEPTLDDLIQLMGQEMFARKVKALENEISRESDALQKYAKKNPDFLKRLYARDYSENEFGKMVDGMDLDPELSSLIIYTIEDAASKMDEQEGRPIVEELHRLVTSAKTEALKEQMSEETGNE